MKTFLLTLAALSVAFPAVAQDKDSATRIAERDLREFKQLVPGTYTNEEQVYFQGNLDMPETDRVPRVELIVERVGDSFETTTSWSDGRVIKARHDYRVEDGAIRASVIRFGRADCERTFTREYESFRGEGCGGTVVLSPEGFRLSTGSETFNMLRARPFKCWVSPRKEDGEYAFYNDLQLHDQGGRVWIDATDEHPRVGLKMRNVQWPTGVNRDSLVLYTYLGDDEDYAPGYTWTDPKTERLAINMRWLQASCTAGEVTYTPGINLKTGSGN